MVKTSDWNSVWIGVFHFACVVAAVFLGANENAIPEFLPKWNGNPLDSLQGIAVFIKLVPGWSFNGAVYLCAFLSLLGTLVLMLLPLGLSCLCQGCKPKQVLPPFCVLFLLAVLARWLGANQPLGKVGLGSTVWALLFGLFIVNVIGYDKCCPSLIRWLSPASKQGEFYIKIGLVLMAVQLQKLAEFGLPALIVSWGVTPICIIFMWAIGRSRFMPKGASAALIMCLACGTSVCGTSAIAAVASAIDAPKDDMVLSISIVSFMTIFFMFALPYIAMATGLHHIIAGAWIGGSINNTGNVVASARILDPEIEDPNAIFTAEGVAAIVKMLQNAAIGPITMVVTVYWISFVEPAEEAAAALAAREKDSGDGASDPLLGRSEEASAKKKLKPPSFVQLYDRFPKFVIGYFACSCALSLLSSEYAGLDDEQQFSLLSLVSNASDWWNLVGFVGLGLETDMRQMGKKLKGGGAIDNVQTTPRRVALEAL